MYTLQNGPDRPVRVETGCVLYPFAVMRQVSHLPSMPRTPERQYFFEDAELVSLK